MAGLTLEGKPIWVGLIVGLILIALCLFGVKYFAIDKIESDIRTADARIDELDKKIIAGRDAERKLPQFIAEVDRLKLELDKLRRILPSSRNTEELIKKIKSLVDQGDFVLRRLSFPKLIPTKEGGEPYAEWPITVSVDGRYHNLAILFNRLSNFSRIINVEQINIGALGDQSVRTISSDFVAKTFVYIEPKETPPAETSTAGKPAGAKP